MNIKNIFKLKTIIAICFITLFTVALAIPNTGLLREKENTAIVAKENRKITAFPQESTTSKNSIQNLKNGIRIDYVTEIKS